MTSAKFWDFFDPLPPCPSIKFTQPPFLCPLFHEPPLPSDAGIISGCSLPSLLPFIPSVQCPMATFPEWRPLRLHHCHVRRTRDVHNVLPAKRSLAIKQLLLGEDNLIGGKRERKLSLETENIRSSSGSRETDGRRTEGGRPISK